MSQSLAEGPLLSEINTLITALQIPIMLETLLDLTPSLILAIFESILRQRIPISPEIRQSRTRSAKVQAMKIFLGVLSDDVLVEDVGIDDVDPRRLADGEPDEVLYVTELLCWLGAKFGYLNRKSLERRSGGRWDSQTASSVYHDPKENQDFLLDRRPQSPSARSTATNSLTTNLSMHSAVADSDTSIATRSDAVLDDSVAYDAPQYHESHFLDAEEDDSHVYDMPHDDDAGDVYSDDPSALGHPRCIHEIPSPILPRRILLTHTASGLEIADSELEDGWKSEAGEQDLSSYCDCPSGIEPSHQQTVRYGGWIDEVDTELEIHEFEIRKHARNQSFTTPSHNVRSPHGATSGRTPQPESSVTSKPMSTPQTHAFRRRNPTRHTSPSQHTLALLSERARLLDELAKLKIAAV